MIFEDSEEPILYTRANRYIEAGGRNWAMFCYSPIEYLYIGRDLEPTEGYGMFNGTPVKKLDIGSKVTTLTMLINLRELSEIRLPKNIKEIMSLYGCNNLRTIICDSSTPPSFESSNISNVVFVEATLFVPKGCVEAYKIADVWKKFFEIKEYDENASFKTVIADKSISISKVFDANGRYLLQPQKGLNIIQYSDGTIKKVIY